ncbi:MAG: hypothetical protein R6W80_10440 [Haliea sp.]
MQQARSSNPSGSASDPDRATDRRRTGSARRWDIWAQQAAAGKRPCFASEQRFTCSEANCPWRDECRDLRAEWHR